MAQPRISQGKVSQIQAGAIWSATLMLDHLGLHSESERVMTALEAACADPATRTRDIGGTATTVEFGDAVMAALERPPHPLRTPERSET